MPCMTEPTLVERPAAKQVEDVTLSLDTRPVSDVSSKAVVLLLNGGSGGKAVDAAALREEDADSAAPIPPFLLPGHQGPMETLVAALKSLINADTIRCLSLPTSQDPDCPSFQQIQSLLSTYAKAAHNDWQRYAFFNPLHYVRNLVEATDEFELIVLCWGPGQRSRIHNHASSHCWLAGLQGEVTETQYKMIPAEQRTEEHALPPPPGGDPSVLHCKSPCPKLDLLKVSCVRPGDVAYVNDNLFLHSVGCPDSVPAPGSVTLHLYAPPIKRATLYETQEDRVIVRKPGFYSIRGVRT